MVVFGRGANLPSLRIPQTYVAGFKVIAELPESAYTQLVTSAKAAPAPFGTVRELRTWLSSEAKSVRPSDIEKIIRVVWSLSKLVSGPKWTPETVVPALDEAARTGISDFKVAEGADFKARLSALMSLDAFNVIEFKAKELQQEVERILMEARIVTDLRPVFGDVIGEKPAAFIVTHTLKLHYHEDGKHREFYVALDENDIRSLKKIAERAEEKSAILKRTISVNGMRSIDLEGSDLDD